MNKKGQVGIIALVIVGIIIIGAFIIIGMYNGLVNKDVATQTEWGKVQSAYQRRADLIPNLVSTVQGAANFESNTQTEIALLRTGAEKVSEQVATASTPEQLMMAQQSMNGLIGRLNVVVEAYPQLKATENFKILQDQLEGTENRIQFERNNYNNAVRTYATSVRSFPTNMIAGMFGFSIDKWKTFEAAPGSDVAPKVTFTN
jgi:LemA protein